jgi:uncharacterized protein with HEPN domain
MRLRDVLSHHYFNVDAELIFQICTSDVPRLLEVVGAMIGALPPADPDGTI